jgi:uncharacterized caspase-like protein
VHTICDAFGVHGGSLFRSVESRPLLGKAATRRAVIDGLRWLRSSARDGDLSVIHFSGYEIYEARGRFLLETADFDPDDLDRTTLSGESIADAVADIPGRVLVLLDTCHSQAAAKAITAANPRAAVFAACRVNELASESQEAQGGYFSTVVATGLAGRADRDADGAVTLEELGDYTTRRVALMSKDQQNPVLVGGEGLASSALSRPGR